MGQAINGSRDVFEVRRQQIRALDDAELVFEWLTEQDPEDTTEITPSGVAIVQGSSG
jgi:hypothetical protein